MMDTMFVKTSTPIDWSDKRQYGGCSTSWVNILLYLFILFILLSTLPPKLEAPPTHLQSKLITLVRGRLFGEARTAADGAYSVEDIINALRDEIVKESSEIIESKLAAIRFDNKNLTDFSSSVESLADKLIASLIYEGVRKDKAKQMATKLVIENCKKSARNDYIKTILASCSFASPKEVLTKFRTEIADLTKEKQLLAYQSVPGGSQHQPYLYPNRGKPNNRGFYNSNYNHNGYRNNHYSHYSNGNHNNYYSNSNRGGPQSRFNSQRSSNPNFETGNYGSNRNAHVRVMQEAEENEQEYQSQTVSENEQSVRWPAQN